MEKNALAEKNKINESLSLINRKNLKLEGIVEINSSSETLLSIKLKDTSLTITGQDLHITRLDISLGILEVDGMVDSIKYGKQANIFKRFFSFKSFSNLSKYRHIFKCPFYLFFTLICKINIFDITSNFTCNHIVLHFSTIIKL